MNIQNKYIEIRQENRTRIMNALLVVTLVLLGLEVLMFFIIKLTNLGVIVSTRDYFLKYTLFPSLCNFLDFSVAMLIIKKAKTDRTKDYAVFACLYGYCTNLSVFHGFFIVLPATYIIPIFVSSMFDNPRYTKFLSFVSFILVIAVTPFAVMLDNTWGINVHIVSSIGVVCIICIVQYITAATVAFSTSKNGLISNSQQEISLKTEPLSIDPLTGFYNHSAFYDILSKARANCVENNTIMTVVLIDIDDFTTINDVYGHKNGDLILTACAEALIKHCGVQSTLSRFGGDQFAAIFRGMTDKEVLNYMNEIRETLLSKQFPEMPEVTIHASCGITEYHGESLSIKEIVDSLLAAVAKAKSTGGSRSVINRN